MRNKLFIERHHQFFVKVCGLTSTFRIKIHASVAKMPPGFVLKICPLMLDLILNHMLISIV